MKNLLSLNFLATCMLAIGVLIAFDSCSTDPCEDVACVNGSLVEDGDNCTCECTAGFSGADCTVEDKCITENVNCLNGGTCADGTCTCTAGYEGDSCQTLTRTRYTGSWGVTDNCSQSGSSQFTVTITASSTADNAILISNFWGTFVNPVNATVDGEEITITSQEPDSDGFFVNGEGTLDDSGATSTITITYNVENRNVTPAVTDVCTNSTWTK